VPAPSEEMRAASMAACRFDESLLPWGLELSRRYYPSWQDWAARTHQRTARGHRGRAFTNPWL